jgi:hypothetical protein
VALNALFITLLFLLLISIAFFVLRKIRISLAKIRLVFAFYMALLFVSIPVFYALAKPGTPESFKSTETGPGQYSYHSRIDEFYDAFYEGRLDNYKGAEINARWNFDYQGERLTITAPEHESYSTRIVLQRKDVRDGKLEVVSYAPKLPNRLTLANPPDIRLKGDHSVILQPERIHLEAIRFDHDFTVAQFTGKGFSMERPHYFFGDTVLYLRIPENLLVDTDESTEHNIYF